MAPPNSHRVTRADFPSTFRRRGVGWEPGSALVRHPELERPTGWGSVHVQRGLERRGRGQAGASCVSGELRWLPWLLGTSSTCSVCEKGPGSLAAVGVAQHTGCCLRASSRLLLLLPGMLCPEAVFQGPGLEHPPPRPWSWVVGREGRASVSRWYKLAKCGVRPWEPSARAGWAKGQKWWPGLGDGEPRA